MDKATEKDKKVANDNLQYNRYIEFKIPKDSITDSILPFSENYNNSNNLKYPPEPNTSDPNAITDTSEGNKENTEPSSQAQEGDANTDGEGTGNANTENTEEKKDEKTLYVKRKRKKAWQCPFHMTDTSGQEGIMVSLSSFSQLPYEEERCLSPRHTYVHFP